MTKPTIEEMVDALQLELSDASPKDRQEFVNCEINDLVQYLHSLGRAIRNKFELWKYKWVPKMIDGVDHSDEHPDAISMRVIEALWLKVRHK